MKYTAPTIVNQHGALSVVLGPKGSMPAFDSHDPTRQVTTSAGYESDE